MKMPEKIKKGLECCNRRTTLVYEKCDDCPYHGEEGCMRKMELDALAYIRQLEAQLVNQATEYSQALKITTEQRDAAVADLNMCCPCEACTRSCTYDKVNPYDECADFEWRGVKKDDGRTGNPTARPGNDRCGDC